MTDKRPCCFYRDAGEEYTSMRQAYCARSRFLMGPPYTYERVLEDSSKYPKSTPDGKFPVVFHDEWLAVRKPAPIS
jgi:hypothetical protein